MAKVQIAKQFCAYEEMNFSINKSGIHCVTMVTASSIAESNKAPLGFSIVEADAVSL